MTNTPGRIDAGKTTAREFAAIQKAAHEGDAKAQLRLARCYRDGSGVDKDGLPHFQWTLDLTTQLSWSPRTVRG